MDVRDEHGLRRAGRALSVRLVVDDLWLRGQACVDSYKVVFALVEDRRGHGLVEFQVAVEVA